MTTTVRTAHCILEPRYSGAESLVLGLVRAQLAAGLPAAIIALRPSQPDFRAELDALRALGCELYVPSIPLVRQQRSLWIRRAARTFRADVVFAHSVLPSLYSRLALLGVSDVSCVTVLHTDNDFENPRLRLFERWLWRRNAIVVGVSPASLRNYRGLVTAKQTTRLVQNGANIEAIRSANVHRNEVREKIYQATADECILLQVGRIAPQKQQLLSVAALASLGTRMSLDKVTLFFAGVVEYTDYHQEIIHSARALGIDGRIRFLGPRQDVPLLLAGADAHLMPSGWEAHSIAAIEAAASGIFCIFTSIESFLSFGDMPGVKMLPEACSASQFADAVATAVQTGDVARRYARDMNTYSFEHCAREYIQLAESLARGRASRYKPRPTT